MQYKSITLLGTNHVSSASIQQIEQVFSQAKYDFVAVELDQQRLEGLLNPGSSRLRLSLIRHIGLFGFLFALIGRYVQKRFGKIARMEAGADMLAAVRLAKKHDRTLVLIDRPLQVTLRRLSKQLTWREKRRLVWDLTLGMVFGPKQKITFNLQDIPDGDVLAPLLEKLKDRYPTFYTVLLAERNTHMARQLIVLMKRHPDALILATVGAGHVPGMVLELERFDRQITAVKPSSNST